MRAREVLEVKTPPCSGIERFWISWQRRTSGPIKVEEALRTSVSPSEREANVTHCAGEEPKGTKPGGGSETTTATGGEGDCGGVLKLGNGR